MGMLRSFGSSPSRATRSTWPWALSSAAPSARSSRRWSTTSSCRRSGCCWARSISPTCFPVARRLLRTLEEAKAAGIPTINYGLFINNILDFVIVAFCIFLVVRQMNRMKRCCRARRADHEGLPAVPFDDPDQGQTLRPLHSPIDAVKIRAKRCPSQERASD